MWGCLAPCPHLSWGTKTTILLSVVLVGVKKGLLGGGSKKFWEWGVSSHIS